MSILPNFKSRDLLREPHRDDSPVKSPGQFMWTPKPWSQTTHAASTSIQHCFQPSFCHLGRPPGRCVRPSSSRRVGPRSRDCLFAEGKKNRSTFCWRPWSSSSICQCASLAQSWLREWKHGASVSTPFSHRAYCGYLPLSRRRVQDVGVVW